MADFVLGKNTTRYLETILQSGKPASKVLVAAVKKFIEVTPIDFCVIHNGGYRTAEEQQELFLAGNSKCDGYVTLSEHQKGLAVDLVPWINGNPDWDRPSCFYLAGAFMSFCKTHGYPVSSGADWDADGNLKEGDSWDPCHMQIKEF